MNLADHKAYAIKGISCSGCFQTIETVLKSFDEVDIIEIDRKSAQVRLRLPAPDYLSNINRKLASAGDYELLEHQEPDSQDITSYRPLIMILLILLAVLALEQWNLGSWDFPLAMKHFMGGFFLVFAFFKLLDLQGFMQAYKKYDLVAGFIPAYGYLYPFLELLLGVYFLSPLHLPGVLWFTLILMTVSALGVVRTLVKKDKIRCACLGTVFNLPMSTVTLVEDLLMVVMCAGMLWWG